MRLLSHTIHFTSILQSGLVSMKNLDIIQSFGGLRQRNEACKIATLDLACLRIPLVDLSLGTKHLQYCLKSRLPTYSANNKCPLGTCWTCVLVSNLLRDGCCVGWNKLWPQARPCTYSFGTSCLCLCSVSQKRSASHQQEHWHTITNIRL